METPVTIIFPSDEMARLFVEWFIGRLPIDPGHMGFSDAMDKTDILANDERIRYDERGLVLHGRIEVTE